MTRVRVCWAIVLLPLLLASCDETAVSPADAGKPPAGLSREQAARVVAKVGDKAITVGDFAATLERMNAFDRLRFQTKKRRRQLMQELIDIELLAQEARRRGLDKEPAVQEAIRQVLREAVLAKARQGLPAPAEISAAQVQEYYDSHKEKFREPERRRVAAIVLGDADKAKEVMGLAKKIDTGQKWGELFFEHSLTAPKKRNKHAPADLAGDLGIVGPPGDPKGDNKNVPKKVREVAFKLAKVGDIHPKLIKDKNSWFIVRLAGMSKGHTRSIAEADRAIRVAILQQMVRDREAALEKKLRARFPVKVDDKALEGVKLPGGLAKYKPFWDREPGAAGPLDGDAGDTGPK